MKLTRWIFLIALFVVPLLSPAGALAGAFEFSLGGSYKRSNYGKTSYSWERTYGISLGYHFSERSQVELAYSDQTNRNKLQGYEDTTFRDRIYSLSWVQAVFPKKKFPVQPYGKAGIAQLNRDGTGTYANGLRPNPQYDQLTGVLGVGLRIYLSKTFAIRGEYVSYLAGANIQTWRDNVAATAGISLYY